jgi:predicted CopG family antitoxin
MICIQICEFVKNDVEKDKKKNESFSKVLVSLFKKKENK